MQTTPKLRSTKTTRLRHLCAQSVKLSRHLERPGVAAVTMGDVMRAEHVVIFTGAALIVVLLIQVVADVVTYVRIKE